MGKKRSLAPIIILVLVLAVLILTLYLLANFTDFDLQVPFIKKESSAVSVIVLEEARDLFALNTLEVVYKTVFPFDFIPADISWYHLLNKVRDKRPLSPEETSYMEIYNLSRSLGINLAAKDYSFLVVTCSVKVGFPVPDSAAAVEVFDTDLEAKSIKVYLPEPAVTDFILEDPKRNSYGYPDLQINPEKWRLLSEYLKGKVMTMIFTEEIKTEALEGGKAFLSRFLGDAGFVTIEFPEVTPSGSPSAPGLSAP